MINKIIIVQHRFGLSTPKTQRMLAAAKAYIHAGLEVCFIYSSREIDNPQEKYPFIRFVRIAEGGRFDIQSYYAFYKTIKSNYTNDSAILFYDLPYYSCFFKSPKYNVFAEVTEIPLFGKQASLIKRVLVKHTLAGTCHFTGLFVISQSLKKYFIEKGVKNIEVINMFVDKARFEGLKKNYDEKYVGYCGSITTQKDGVDVLIKSFALFNKQQPDYKLYLFGIIDNEIVKEELFREAEILGVSTKVIFTGQIDSKDIPQKLMDATILAMARPDSRQAQYGFPTKLGEYLATGNPVVLTGVGEIPFYLKDGVNAFVVKPGDYHAFAEKLIWIVEHQEEAERIAAKGKELVSTEFSSITQTEKALRFINSMIS